MGFVGLFPFWLQPTFGPDAVGRPPLDTTVRITTRRTRSAHQPTVTTRAATSSPPPPPPRPKTTTADDVLSAAELATVFARANNSWTCHKCTYDNKRNVTSCRMCGLKRVRRYNEKELLDAACVAAETTNMWGNRANVRRMPRNGHCLFHAVANEVLRDSSLKAALCIREACVQTMEANKKFFAPYLPENRSWSSYIAAMRSRNVVVGSSAYGGMPEIVALSLRLGRPFVVYHNHGRNAHVVRHPKVDMSAEPIALFYNGHNHYDGLRL